MSAPEKELARVKRAELKKTCDCIATKGLSSDFPAFQVRNVDSAFRCCTNGSEVQIPLDLLRHDAFTTGNIVNDVC